MIVQLPRLTNSLRDPFDVDQAYLHRKTILHNLNKPRKSANSLDESELAKKIVHRWEEASVEVRQAYKQFIGVVGELIDGEMPPEGFSEVALTAYHLFGKPAKEETFVDNIIEKNATYTTEYCCSIFRRTLSPDTTLQQTWQFFALFPCCFYFLASAAATIVVTIIIEMTKPNEGKSDMPSLGEPLPPPPPVYSHDNSSKIEIKLDGTNYPLWSKFVEIFVAGKDKYGFLLGESVKPATTCPTYKRWLADNAFVQGWLLGSMTPKVMGMFIRLPTAQAIWEAVARTYYDGADQSIIYELNNKAFHMRQSGRPIFEYYGELNTIWQELDQRCPNDMTDVTDVVRLNDRIEKQRVYMFLAGLDPEFDKVRADVLRMDPFPSVEGAFAYVCCEAQRQATMLAPPQVSDSSALLINKGNSGDRKCTHCGRMNHIRDACWRLNGYPEWYLEKRKKGPLKNGTASLASSSGNSSSTPQGNIWDSQIQFSNSGYHNQGDDWNW